MAWKYIYANNFVDLIEGVKFFKDVRGYMLNQLKQWLKVYNNLT
jgi:hypothetical protein